MKVFIVYEEYKFDCKTDTNFTVCATFNKAKEVFDNIIERESMGW